jgi:hypothetical protein
MVLSPSENPSVTRLCSPKCLSILVSLRALYLKEHLSGFYFNKHNHWYIEALALWARGVSDMFFLLFSQPRMMCAVLEVARKGWVLMNKSIVGVSMFDLLLANQNVLHG